MMVLRHSWIVSFFLFLVPAWSLTPPSQPTTTTTKGQCSNLVDVSSRRGLWDRFMVACLLSSSSFVGPAMMVVMMDEDPTSVSSTVALALDMDAFIDQQLDGGAASSSSKSTSPLTEDQALCKYGFPSPATGQACVRAGMSTKRVGSLDAFGNVNRGNFIRCKQVYIDNGTAYEKKTVCD